MDAKIRNLWQETRDLTLGTTVDHLPTAPSAFQFLRDYVSLNKPCIISSSYTSCGSSSSSWPSISRSLWSDPTYLLRKLSSSYVTLHLTPDGRADSLAPNPANPTSLCFASAAAVSVRFEDAIGMIEAPKGPVVAYAQQQDDCFRSEYAAALGGDVEEHIPWATEAFGGHLPEAVNLWIGNGRSETWFHKDHYENIYVVVTGEKHFLLLPPTEVHRMYVRDYPVAGYRVEEEDGGGLSGRLRLRLEPEEPERLVPWCSVDPYPRSAGEMERQRRMFPLYFEGPRPLACTVKAGEILYLPSMWFHHVRQSPDANGRAIAINYWYDMQFDIRYAYFNFLQSIECPTIGSCGKGEEDDVDRVDAEDS